MGVFYILGASQFNAFLVCNWFHVKQNKAVIAVLVKTPYVKANSALDNGKTRKFA